MPPRRRRTKDIEEESAVQREKAIEIPDDIDDDDSPSSDEDYDDDPIVKTYDVFVSDQLKDHIYLLQYPIRNQDEQYYDESAPLEARMKPKEGTLELDVPIDTHNFSILRGEKFAGHSQTESGVKRETKPLDRQRLSGTAQPLQASYFVAVMRGGLPFY
jgi:DNA-directed RNA polymerase III subunit RPC5